MGCGVAKRPFDWQVGSNMIERNTILMTVVGIVFILSSIVYALVVVDKDEPLLNRLVLHGICIFVVLFGVYLVNLSFA